MPKIIITPWRDESELLDVRSQFYPSSATSSHSPELSRDLRPDACRIVEAWKLRGHLPHAVEATALLTDAILHDDASRNSVFSIRATYAAAFSRFVTGLVDTKLGGAGQRGTMFNRASMIGLPVSFVELRHEAAHRELPSLVLLRNYTNRALEWLWNYYWVKIGAHNIRTPNTAMEDVAMSTERADNDGWEDRLRTRVKHILQQYVQQVQSSSSGGSTKKSLKSSLSLSQSLVSICKTESAEGVEVISTVLLEDDFLVPKDRELFTPMDTTFSMWDHVLQTASNSYGSFLSILTEEMAKVLTRHESSSATTASPFLEGVFLWLEHITTSNSWARERYLVSMNMIRLLCDDFPNHWTTMLGNTLRSKDVSSTTPTAIAESPESRSAQLDHRDIGPAQLADDLRSSGWEFPG